MFVFNKKKVVIMSWPVITIMSTTIPFSGGILMAGSPSDIIEERRFPRRFYNFNMRLNVTFPYQSTSMLFLTDNDGDSAYMMIDRLGNPVRAEQIQMYTQGFRCIACQYDAVTKTIRVLSPICPTDYYIEQWIDQRGYESFTIDNKRDETKSLHKTQPVEK